MRGIWIASFIVLLGAALEAKVPSEWKWSGKEYGVTLFMKLENGCTSGPAKIKLRMKNDADRPIVMEFRVNDSNWRETVQHLVEPLADDSSVVLEPKASSCYPYIDRVFASEPTESPAALGAEVPENHQTSDAEIDE